MLKSLKNRVLEFLSNDKKYPIITVLAAGFYPLLYYYNMNYALINSKAQLFFFISIYFILPLALYVVLNVLFKYIAPLKQFRKYVLPILNISCFFILVVISIYGFDTIKIVIAIALGVVLGFFLEQHLKKIVVFQLILIGLVLPKLIPDFYRDITHSRAWMSQPDAIEEVVFKKRPNVYVIQPDGYVNFSSLKDSIYNFDNSEFENFLNDKGFESYTDFRSNYFSTLSSNSSMFGMNHHYYGNSTLGINPSQNKRDEIVGNNPVLETFKKNDYKSFLILHVPYLLSNRPKVDFDYCNISLDEVSYISRGFSLKKTLTEDTKSAIRNNKSTSNFFFIESMLPSHIATHYDSSSSVENERNIYLKRLQLANDWLRDIINLIEKEDPNSLIVIAADHGGYVGLRSSMESHNKITNEGLVNSMFSAVLSIKWPDDEHSGYDEELKTSVNLFRILFSYLSQDDTYLNNLQDDKSFLVIEKGAPHGVYEVINDSGSTVFKKI